MAKSISVKRIRRKNILRQSKGALDIIEEAVQLVRTFPATVALYYIGSLPFMLALLYFWTDMIRNAFAYRHCIEASLGLAILFLWMKCWQTVFTRRLMTRIRGTDPGCWSFRQIVRLVVVQTIMQPWGLWILPLALLLTLPFPWMYAFYQNVTVFGDGEDGNVRTILKRSGRQAKLWPKQNLLLIWLLSPWLLVVAAILGLVIIPVISAARTGMFVSLLMYLFFLVFVALSPLGIVISANIGATVLLIPQALKLFFGIETIFTLSGMPIFNTTFAAVVCALTYLCLDPLVKAADTLRCFYGEAVQTGEDLKVELRGLAASGKMMVNMGLLLISLCGVIPLSVAEATESVSPDALYSESLEPPASARELDDAIRKVLNKVEYAWRLPREKPPAAEKEPPGFLTGIVDMLETWGEKMHRWFLKILDWFEKLWPRRTLEHPGSGSDSGWAPKVQGLMFVLLAGVTCLLALLLWRAWKKRRQQALEVAAEEMTLTPDITDDNVDASDLPEDGWLALAKELLAKGQLRLALRALYLASLACLARHELLTIAKFKSDRDYERELKRRAHAMPSLLTVFAENVVQFERTWYGMYEVTQSMIAHVTANYEKIQGMLSDPTYFVVPQR